MKPVPEIVAAPMFTVAVPVFVRLRLWVALLPTATLPKARLVALAERTPVPGVCDWPPGLVYPAQLDMMIEAAITNRGAKKVKRPRARWYPGSFRVTESKAAFPRLGGCVFMTRSV